MKKEENRKIKIDPIKLQEVAQKKRTITIIAVLVVVVVFVSWVIFFRSVILPQTPESSSRSADKLREAFGALSPAFNDFSSDLDKAKAKREEDLAALNKADLDDEQMAALTEKLSEGIKAQAEVDISNWQTYRNDEYGFEFQYPDYYFEDKKDMDDESTLEYVKHFWEWNQEGINYFIEHNITSFEEAGSLSGRVDLGKYSQEEIEEGILHDSLDTIDTKSVGDVLYYSFEPNDKKGRIYFIIPIIDAENSFLLIDAPSSTSIILGDGVLPTFKFTNK